MADFNQIVEHRPDVTTTGPTTFIGKVKLIIFERGLFKILIVEVGEANFEWDQKEITVKGQLGDVVEGDRYEFEGRVVDDQRYGLQFAGTGAHVVLPQNAPQLATFVKFHGLKLHAPKKSTTAIFKALGKTAMKQVTDDPQVLQEIDGFGVGDQERLIKFFTRLDIGNTTGKIINQLKAYGMSERLVNVIFDRFGVQTLITLDKDPYSLCAIEDSELSFRRIDALARQEYKVAGHDQRRLQAALLVAVRGLTNQTGDSWTPKERLIRAAAQLAGVPAQELAAPLADLEADDRLIVEDDRAYPAALAKAEQQIADALGALMEDSAVEIPTDAQLNRALKKVEDGLDYDYDPIQRQAIKLALKQPLMLLTGGPGTGKTTIVKGIVNTYLKLNRRASAEDICLVAPTGRAAKQIAGVTNLPASTIHRLLGLTPDLGDDDLVELPVEELDQRILIVDEMSMTSLILFALLMRAVGPETRVILVGDFDQLPSVGPGQVFRDLLEAKDQLPQIRLTEIHRQAADSSIIPLAQKINAGEVDNALFAPADPGKYQHRRFFTAPLSTVAERLAGAVKLYRDNFHLSLMEMQVLAPIHGGQAGTDYLNDYLQEALNPAADDKPAVAINGKTFRLGDKVMQTVNDPDRDVYNGDLGIIQTIEGEQAQNAPARPRGKKVKLRLVVDFDGVEVEYSRPQEIAALQLAYCMTIHKAQGSQARVVLLTMVPEYFPNNPNAPTMMRRNLLYTAVTRASQALMMIGDPAAFTRCAMLATNYRQTTLTERIKARFGDATIQVKPVAVDPIPKKEKGAEEEKPAEDAPVEVVPEERGLTPEMVEEELVDPLIGMAGLKPEQC